MALGGAGQMVIPDIVKGGIQADALEAVVEADRPALHPSEGGQIDFGELLEAGDLLRARCELISHAIVR